MADTSDRSSDESSEDDNDFYSRPMSIEASSQTQSHSLYVGSLNRHLSNLVQQVNGSSSSEEGDNEDLPKKEVGHHNGGTESVYSLSHVVDKARNHHKEIEESAYELTSLGQSTSIQDSVLSMISRVRVFRQRVIKKLDVYDVGGAQSVISHEDLSIVGPFLSLPVTPAHSSSYTMASIHGNDDGLEFCGYNASTKDEVLRNTIDALMHIVETPSKQCISIKQLKEDILLQECVSCNLLLAVVVGLPNCGKSKTIYELLKNVLVTPALIDHDPKSGSLQSYVKNGLSSYSVIIVGRKPFDNLIWLPEAKSSMHVFSCGAVILHNSLLQGQQVELVDKIQKSNVLYKGFSNRAINMHLHHVYEDIDMLIREGDVNPEIKRILPSGVTAVNIIDAAVNQGVFDFLTLSARYCHRQFGFIFLDLERDVPTLDEIPTVDSQNDPDIHIHVFRSKSRIHHLIRFAALSFFFAQCAPSSMLVAWHNGDLPRSKINSLILQLRNAVQSEIDQQGLPKDLVHDVIAINPDNKDDLKVFKMALEAFVKNRHTAMLSLKLSWVFLRSFLQNDPKVSKMLSIPYNELRGLAIREMGFSESEVNDFLVTYTEFGSLLYLKDVLPEQVILQPAVFVNHLQTLFHLERNEKFSHGIIALAKVHEKMGKDIANVVVPFLCKSRLGVQIDSSDVLIKEGSPQLRRRSSSFTRPTHTPIFIPIVEPLLFIPSSRLEFSDINEYDRSSLYIMYESNVTPPNMAGMFLQKLLHLKCKLVPTSSQNSIELNFKNGVLKILFTSDCISLNLSGVLERSRQSLCTEIVSQCSAALSEIAVFFPDLTYKYALLCIDSSDNLECIVNDVKLSVLCRRCREFRRVPPVREHWVKSVEKEEAEDGEVFTLESLGNFASKLAAVDKDKFDISLFANALGIDKTEPGQSKHTHDRQILSMLVSWETKMGIKKATKQKLMKILYKYNPELVSVLQ